MPQRRCVRCAGTTQRDSRLHLRSNRFNDTSVLVGVDVETAVAEAMAEVVPVAAQVATAVEVAVEVTTVALAPA